MPELPEVETTMKGLKPIINSTIINIKIYTYKLRFYIPQNISFATTILSTESRITNSQNISLKK